MAVIDIPFESHEVDLIRMQKIFNSLGVDAFSYSHHELAAASQDYTAMDWRNFLMDARVQDAMGIEVGLMQQSAIIKMMKGIEHSKSPGQAQLLSTLITQTKNNKVKDGPVFIYSYVPLNEEEKHAPDIQIMEGDPFKITIPDGR